MMKCPVCSSDIDALANFCPACGAKLVATADPAGQKQAKASDSSAAPIMAASSAAASTASAMRRARAPDEPERDLWEGVYSPKAMYGVWAIVAALSMIGLFVGLLKLRSGRDWGLLLVGLAVAWLVPLATLGYRRAAVHYRLTTQRLFIKRGMLKRVTDRVEVIDINDITYEQGMFERLVGVGSILIKSSDRTDPNLWLYGVEQVAEVATKIDQARRADQLRRGFFVETSSASGPGPT